jgi:hypothetical protein
VIGENMRDVFEKLKLKPRVEITLATGKTIGGSIIEVNEQSVGINTGDAVEYFSYRYIESVQEVKMPKK